MKLLDYLKAEGVTDDLIKLINVFRRENLREDAARGLLEIDEHGKAVPHERMVVPSTRFTGGHTLILALSALLAGKSILLIGEKGSGKNVLAETLALVLNRPLYEAPMHVHADASALLGEKTLQGGEVVFEKAALVDAMENGGFCVLDEVNMARPEVLSVIHAATDSRRRIDVKGYGVVTAHPAFRCIATMNFGYAGTQELNEAMADRFVVLKLDALSRADLQLFLQTKHPDLLNSAAEVVAGLVEDIQKKARNSEVTTKTLSIRGVLDALDLIKIGVNPRTAFQACIVHKAMDAFEEEAVNDLLNTRIPIDWKYDNFFLASPQVTQANEELNVDFSNTSTKTTRRKKVAI